MTRDLLAAAQLLDAAGIASRITASGLPDLGPDADAALAWTVREGATNVVRHSRATQVDITHRSGLAGLTDRVRNLGGEIAAGSMPPHGFRLRVVVPIDAVAP